MKFDCSMDINEIAAALAKAQGAMETAEKNATNPHFQSKYSTLAAIINAIRKPLSDNGLCYTQVTQMDDKGRSLRTMLIHASGQFFGCEYPLPDSATPQQMGSALTYARRYSLAAIVGAAPEDDDDGNVAETVKPGAKAPVARPDAMSGKPRPTQRAPSAAAADTADGALDVAAGDSTTSDRTATASTAKLSKQQIQALETEARDAADRGSEVFAVLWKRLKTVEQRDVIEAIGADLRKRMQNADLLIEQENEEHGQA